MCLASVYRADNSKKIICDKVTYISFCNDGKTIVFEDLFGTITKFNGSIDSIDLKNNVVRVKSEDK